MALTLHSLPALQDAPTAVVLLALDGKRELQSKRPYVIDFLTGDEVVIWAELDAEPVGVMCVKPRAGGRTWWVDSSFVAPSARRLGVHLAMREKLRACAREAGVRAIEYLVRLDNEGQLASMRSAGVSPTSYHVRYEP